MPKPRLLIVGPESPLAAEVAASLSRSSYQIVGITACGAEALVLAGQLRPDLVVMDMQLQGVLDGVAAATELRNRLDLPVVFVSACAADETFDRAMAARPLGYIVQPFGDRELRIVVEMALHQHQAAAALREKCTELERFNRVTTERELRMIELKQEVNGLLRAAGRPDKYRIVG